MTKPAQQPGTATSPKREYSLRNGNPPNRNTSGLKRGGGTRIKTICTLPELEFAAWLAQGVTVANAAHWASLPAHTAIYALARTPRVRAERDRIIKQYQDEAADRVAAMREKLGTFVVGEYQHRTRTARTQPTSSAATRGRSS